MRGWSECVSRARRSPVSPTFSRRRVYSALHSGAAQSWKIAESNDRSVFAERSVLSTVDDMTLPIDELIEMFQSTTTTTKGCLRGFFANAVLASAVIMLASQSVARADEVPAFFLKIAKNIPRVGRSDNFRDYLNNRPDDLSKVTENEPSGVSATHGNGSPFAGPSKRRMDYPPFDAPDAWAWQHFPLAIEGPRELWRTLAGYSTDNSDDLDNEVWARQKRTGSLATNSQM